MKKNIFQTDPLAYYADMSKQSEAGKFAKAPGAPNDKREKSQNMNV